MTEPRLPGDPSLPDLDFDLGYADPPPPPGMADRARRQGLALRRRRRVAGAAGLTLGVCTLLAVGSTVIRTGSQPAPPAGRGATAVSPTTPGPVRSTGPAQSPRPSGALPPVGRTPPIPTASSVPGPSTPPSDCTFAVLTVRIGTSQGAAGHSYTELVFRNSGARGGCTLYGAPGVSFLDANGRMLGFPAQKDTSQGGSKQVLLAPGGTAYSALGIPDPGVYGGPTASVCSAGQATQLNVYPPNLRQSVRVPLPSAISVCTTRPATATITPVQGGRMP